MGNCGPKRKQEENSSSMKMTKIVIEVIEPSEHEDENKIT
jgi:hypothetical protein